MSKSVDKNDDDDDEWEVVDELLVHVDLAGIIQGSTTSDGQQLNTKFIGLDTDRPIVQIGSQVNQNLR
jgi:hypothetical protein